MRRRNTRPLEPDRGGTSAKDRADGKGEGPGSSLTTDAKQCIKSWYRYADAGSYPQGSTEYNDVLDLAARLFPDSPEANINAAAVALTKGERPRTLQKMLRL